MNIRHFRIFVTVYREGNISRAAQKLGISQPATSLSIHEMEKKYQVKLFVRAGRGVKPTEAADKIYQSAARLDALYNELDQQMLTWNEAGRISVGASVSVGACILPDMIREFHHDHKDLKVRVAVESTQKIMAMVLEDRVDLAIVEGDVNAEKIHSMDIMGDELVAVCSRFHRFTKMKQVKPEELKAEDFIMREPDSGTRMQAESALRQLGIELDPLWESISTAAIVEAVSKDLGITILPKRMIQDKIDAKEVVPFKIEGMELKRKYRLIYHDRKFITPPIQDFMDLAKGWKKTHK